MSKRLTFLLYSLCLCIVGGYYLINYTSFCKKNTNPLLDLNFYEDIDFSKIKDTDYKFAIIQVGKEVSEKLQVIFDNNDEPNFFNTIVALEESKFLLDRLSDLISSLVDIKANKDIIEAGEVLNKVKLEFNDRVFHNRKFFEKVKFIYDNQNNFDLDETDRILLEKVYQTFIQEGVTLNKKDQETLNEIVDRLAQLQVEFRNNQEEQTRMFVYNIPESEVKKKLKRLPESSIQSFKQVAEKRGEKGYSLDFSNREINKILLYVTNRSFRETFYKIRKSMTNSPLESEEESKNSKIVVEIVNYPSPKGERACNCPVVQTTLLSPTFNPNRYCYLSWRYIVG